jgi:hypothetical protein
VPTPPPSAPPSAPPRAPPPAAQSPPDIPGPLLTAPEPSGTPAQVPAPAWFLSGGLLTQTLSPLPQYATIAALLRGPADPGSGSDSTRAAGHSGARQPTPSVAPESPRFPGTHTSSTPGNSAPGGGGGGFGPSPIGALAAFVALLAFGALLGGLLPDGVASKRPADLAFHLKRPG